MGDHHLQVSKHVEGGRVCTRVKVLDGLGERGEELAQLAGGDREEARRYGASLLGDPQPRD